MRKVKKNILLFLAFSLVLHFLSGCSDNNANNENLDNAKGKTEIPKISTQAPANIIRFAIVPSSNASDLEQTYKPLARYLEKALGKRIILKFAKSYETIADNLGKEYDMASMGAYSYIEANKMNGAEAVVKAIRNGKPFYNSVIFINTSSNIKTYSDFKGKYFVFVDRYSTAGFLYPAAELIKNGIDISKDLKKYKFVKGHDNTVLNVSSKSADAGAAYNGAVEKFITEDKKKNIKIFKELDEPIPADPVVVSKKINEDLELKKKIIDAFINLKGVTILKTLGVEGYIEAHDKDYNILREKINLVDKYIK